MLVHVLHVHKNVMNTQDIIGFYFKVEKWSGEAINAEPNKIAAAQWFDLENLPNNITEHAMLAIDGIKKDILYSEHE